MKKTLVEELERIHSITYGKEMIQEQKILDKILSTVGLDNKTKKVDDPKKADLVSDDVNDFYQNLELGKKSGGISQQERGTMTFQKEVESMQIGLMLLGYDLPKHGVDGLFGPETADAVRRFKSENLQINESSTFLRNTLDKLGYDEKGNELTSGGEITDQISSITSEILTQYKAVRPQVKVVITSGNDKHHQNKSSNSRHKTGQAVDLVIQPYNSDNAKALINILNQFKSKDSKFTYIDEYTNPSKYATGPHFHLQYGGSTKASGMSIEVATPEMIDKLIEMLKAKGVKSEDLKKYIDPVTSGGGVGFTDLDLSTLEGVEKYTQICQKFINSRQPNPLGITGEMLANGAVQAFKRYQKFVPAELALAQLVAEGGIGSKNPNAKPVRTKNPFNVGNVDSGAVETQNSVQDGINRYYNLIAREYLGKGRTAKDLVNNFVNKDGNRYASAQNYETVLSKMVGDANRVASQVMG